MRLADEARTLARVVVDARGTIDDVLGDEAIDEAAAARQLDADELRRAIEIEIAAMLHQL
jgi:hypothetical protein